MNNIENNDFMILNSIIYKIHTATDFQAMRQNTLEMLKLIIDFDAADFHLSKGDGSLTLHSQVSYNCDKNLSLKYEDLDYSQGIHNTGKSMVYRESDILSDEKRVETEYYKKVYRVNNWHYSLQLILAFNDTFLGVITLYKTKGKVDFHYSDIFLLEMLKDHMAFRIQLEHKASANIGKKLTISQATLTYGLTKKESEVLNWIMQGNSNDEICELAFISKNTLKKHILKIYRKIGVNNRVQLFKSIREYNPKG